MCDHENTGQPGNDAHTFLSIKSSFELMECLNCGKESLMFSTTHFLKKEWNGSTKIKFTQGHQCEDVDVDLDLSPNFTSSDIFFY